MTPARRRPGPCHEKQRRTRNPEADGGRSPFLTSCRGRQASWQDVRDRPHGRDSASRRCLPPEIRHRAESGRWAGRRTSAPVETVTDAEHGHADEPRHQVQLADARIGNGAISSPARSRISAPTSGASCRLCVARCARPSGRSPGRSVIGMRQTVDRDRDAVVAPRHRGRPRVNSAAACRSRRRDRTAVIARQELRIRGHPCSRQVTAEVVWSSRSRRS